MQFFFSIFALPRPAPFFITYIGFYAWNFYDNLIAHQVFRFYLAIDAHTAGKGQIIITEIHYAVAFGGIY
jgi:hypothetical protein